MIRPRPTHQKEHRTGRPTAPARGVRGGVAAGKHRLVRGTESTPGREEGHASPGSALRLHSRRQRALSEQARNETHSHDTTEGEKARKCCVKNPQVFFLSFKAKSNLQPVNTPQSGLFGGQPRSVRNRSSRGAWRVHSHAAQDRALLQAEPETPLQKRSAVPPVPPPSAGEASKHTGVSSTCP